MKKFFYIFMMLLFWINMNAQNELPSYQFKSTSSYQCSQPTFQNGITIYEIGATTPYQNNGPRRIIRPGDEEDDGEQLTPDYNPNDPKMPLGDSTLPLVLIILGYLGKKIYDNRIRNICEL